jgi:hypothetical protein
MAGKRKPKVSSGVLAKAWIALDATLADDMPADATAPLTQTVWVEVTCEGDYKGYPGGGFKFNQSVFAELIKNFRAHPSFELDPATGEGIADVVPWDFNHASEYAPTEGSVPYLGAPAQGWIQDLRVQTDANGKLGLFAKTRWLEPARSYVKNGQYKWASVTVIFDARDPKTNEKVGCILTSVALTNTPFVEGMEELIAAQRNGGQQVRAGAYIGNCYCEPASSAEDAFEKLRSLFSLPATSSAADLISQIMRLQEWSISGGAPLGIEVDDLVGGIRVILNLPALSTTEEVFAEAQKLLGRILEEQANRDASGAPATPVAQPPVPPAPPAASASRSGDTMSFKLIASKLGVQENQAACEEAVTKLVELRGVLCTKLALETIASDAKLLEAAAGAADVRGKLGAILAALGLKPEEADAAIDKIAQQMEGAAKLKEVMPELEGLKAKVQEQAAKEETADVDAALASKGLSGDEDMKAAYTMLHRQDPAKFRTKYLSAPAAGGTPTGGGNAPVLLRSVAAGKGGAEHKVTVDDQGRVILQPAGRAGTPVTATGGGGDKQKIALAGYSGRNSTERLMAYLRAHGDDKLSHDDLFMKAMKLRNSGQVEILDAAV